MTEQTTEQAPIEAPTETPAPEAPATEQPAAPVETPAEQAPEAPVAEEPASEAPVDAEEPSEETESDLVYEPPVEDGRTYDPENSATLPPALRPTPAGPKHSHRDYKHTESHA